MYIYNKLVYNACIHDMCTQIRPGAAIPVHTHLLMLTCGRAGLPGGPVDWDRPP